MTETRGFCVTAVHGTNDRDADWAKPGSRLHRAIELNFGALCQWREPFNWSGDNRQEDRVTASAELADRLLDSVRTNSDYLQFVIAHSHGGNIALYTALDPRLKGRIDGVITVGTPYFHAIQRNAFTLFRGVAHGLLPAAAIAVFLPFVVADQLRMSGALHPIALLVLSLLGLLVAMVSFVALVVWLSRRDIPGRHATAAMAAVQSLRGEGKATCPFHCIWRSDDEVQAGAVLFDAITTALMFLRRPLVLLALWLTFAVVSIWWFPFTLPRLESIWPYCNADVPSCGSIFLAGLEAMLPAAVLIILLSVVVDLTLWMLLKILFHSPFGYGLPNLPLSVAPYLRILVGLTPMQAENITFYELNRPSSSIRNHSLDDDHQFIGCLLNILSKALAPTERQPLP